MTIVLGQPRLQDFCTVMTVRTNEAEAEWRKARPFRTGNALRKMANTWSDFLAFTVLKGCALIKNLRFLKDCRGIREGAKAYLF